MRFQKNPCISSFISKTGRDHRLLRENMASVLGRGLVPHSRHPPGSSGRVSWIPCCYDLSCFSVWAFCVTLVWGNWVLCLFSVSPRVPLGSRPATASMRLPATQDYTVTEHRSGKGTQQSAHASQSTERSWIIKV